MEKKESLYISSLNREWSIFRNIFFAPSTIIFLLIIVGTVLYSIYDKNNTFLIQVIIPVLTGIFGTIITRRWDNLMGNNLVNDKGKSATRSLKLLFEEQISLEYRCRLILNRYFSAQNNKQNNNEVIRTVFEEVINKSLSLENQINDSIENWNDILHDEATRNILDDIRTIKDELKKSVEERTELQVSLRNPDVEQPDERKEIIGKIQVVETKIANLEKDLKSKSKEFGVPSIGSSLIATSGSPLSSSIYTASMSEPVVPQSWAAGATGPVSWQSSSDPGSMSEPLGNHSWATGATGPVSWQSSSDNNKPHQNTINKSQPEPPKATVRPQNKRHK